MMPKAPKIILILLIIILMVQIIVFHQKICGKATTKLDHTVTNFQQLPTTNQGKLSVKLTNPTI